jgi:NAD(P)-dependent dehydrogenase (short-subunit alcohol dehydrogenase family)
MTRIRLRGSVSTDVTDEAAVRRLAEAALGFSGRIDVWVNDAGVTTFAPLLDGPSKITAESSRPTSTARSSTLRPHSSA